MQFALPGDAAVTPAGHAVQLASPAAAYEPAAQTEQPATLAVPGPETEPAGQAAQPAALPGLETAPKNPRPHTVHAATEVAPVAAPAVVMPRGQAVQAAAPAEAEKLPTGHGKQLAAPDADNVPAGHFLQLGAPTRE